MGEQFSWSPAEAMVHIIWKVGQDVMLAAASPIRFCYPSIAVHVGRTEIVKNMMFPLCLIVHDPCFVIPPRSSWSGFILFLAVYLVQVKAHSLVQYSQWRKNFLKVNYLIWIGTSQRHCYWSSGASCLLIEDAATLNAWLLVRKVRPDPSLHCPFSEKLLLLLLFAGSLSKVSAISLSKYLQQALFWREVLTNGHSPRI